MPLDIRQELTKPLPIVFCSKCINTFGNILMTTFTFYFNACCLVAAVKLGWKSPQS